MPSGGSRRLLLVNGVIVLVLLLAAGGTVYALTKTSSSSASSALRTTPVGRGTVAETITAAGSVTTAASATLNFSSSGMIAEVRVRLGDRVTKGQTVARLDGEYAQANLKAADAQVSADEQSLDDAEYQKDHPQAQQQSSTATSTASTGTAATGTGTGTASTTGNFRDSTPGNAIEDTSPTSGDSNGGTYSTNSVLVMPGGDTSRTGTPPGGSPSASTLPPGMSPMGPSTASTASTASTVSTSSTASTMPAGTTMTSTMGTSTAAQQQQPTSEDPGEAAVRSARAKLDQDRAARINAFQATENLDLVAPEDGTVVSLDGLVGQMAGPQGIVLSSTSTGNPAGGRLPDGSAISSGAGSGQSATSGSSTGSAAAGGAATTTGSTGGSTATAAPSAPAVMTIANLAAMQVLAQVPELDVGKVANAQPVAVSVNALPGQKIPGTVTSINLLPGSQTTVQYGTAVLMPTPPPGLRPGMSASVSITTAQADNVTFLPSVAVTPVGGPDSGQGTVQVLQPDGTTAQRTIGTGLSSDTVTQVTTGLSLGDLVVLPDQSASSAATVRGLRGGGGGGGGGAGGGGGGAGGGAGR